MRGEINIGNYPKWNRVNRFVICHRQVTARLGQFEALISPTVKLNLHFPYLLSLLLLETYMFNLTRKSFVSDVHRFTLDSWVVLILVKICLLQCLLLFQGIWSSVC